MCPRATRPSSRACGRRARSCSARRTCPSTPGRTRRRTSSTGGPSIRSDAGRTCGGSSGGEAALLGADAAVVGIGTDGGGSIRVPSHYCGIVGLRPTAGLVPETGCWPSTRDTGMLDLNAVGPMARFVEDLALVLPVIAGPDGVDPYVHGRPSRTARATSTSAGCASATTPTTASGPSRPGRGTAVERAAAALGCVGWVVEEVTPPDLSPGDRPLLRPDGRRRRRPGPGRSRAGRGSSRPAAGPPARTTCVPWPWTPPASSRSSGSCSRFGRRSGLSSMPLRRRSRPGHGRACPAPRLRAGRGHAATQLSPVQLHARVQPGRAPRRGRQGRHGARAPGRRPDRRQPVPRPRRPHRRRGGRARARSVPGRSGAA